MSRSPLLAPRWIVAHVLVVLATVAFVALGMWQLDRWGEERAFEAALEERLHGDPVPLADLARQPVDDIEHRPVIATGTFLTDDEVLLRSRSYEGRSGYHVVTPLLLADGNAVLVNRGWVPFELDEPPVAQAAPPDGEVTVTGVVVASTPQPSGFAPTDPADGELERMFHADVERIGQQTDTPLLPFLVQLTNQSPAKGGLPVAAALPQADPSQNLSYAGQWFAFATIAVVGYALGMRHVLRNREDADPEPGARRHPEHVSG